MPPPTTITREALQTGSGPIAAAADPERVPQPAHNRTTVVVSPPLIAPDDEPQLNQTDKAVLRHFYQWVQTFAYELLFVV
jgi:hypothetical protein